jgi:hypothetical protein
MIQDSALVLFGSFGVNDGEYGQLISGSGTVIGNWSVDLFSQGLPQGSGDIGQGAPVYVRWQVTQAFSTATSIQLQVIVADDPTLTTNVFVIGSTDVIPLASLTLGARGALEINPRLGSKGQRYLGARLLVSGSELSGSIFVDLGLDIQDGLKLYPKSYTVL